MGLLAGQLVLLVQTPPGSYVGDEPYFVEKAQYLSRHGGFRRIEEAGPTSAYAPAFWGNSDWRPPGYPVFLRLCSGGDFEPSLLKRRCSVVQFGLMALVLAWFHVVACLAFGNSPVLLFSAALLGSPPWAFAYAGSMLADSVCASMTSLALLTLFRFASSDGSVRSTATLVGGTLGASLSFLLRPESIAVVPVLVGIAILARRAGPRQALQYLALSVGVFSLVLTVQIAYRAHVANRLEIFGPVKFFNMGAANWVHTWFYIEKGAYEGFLYRLAIAEARLEDLPRRAFGSEEERQEIARALAVLRERRAYDREIDGIFQGVADRRVRQNFFSNVILTRIWRTANLWVNLETNSQTLNALVAVPSWIRRGILAALFVAKGLIGVLAVAGMLACARRWLKGRQRWEDALTLLAATLVVSRTILVGFVLSWATHRYMLSAWPALLWTAVCGGSEIAILYRSWWLNRRSLAVRMVP